MLFRASAGTRSPIVLFGGALAIVLLASLADPLAYTHLSLPNVYSQNWGRLFRVIGWLPFWLLAGVAFYRVSESASAKRQALLLMAAPTLSGALSEILKLLVRRGRPTAADGAYVFQAFTDHPFSTSHFGMPSGDATVAFATALILARTWPRGRFIWYALAVGCALGRVLSRAHFLSDVTVAAMLGMLVADRLWRRYDLVHAGSGPSTV